MKPRISVMIPTNRSAEVLRPALTALTAQTLSPDQFEVVVVANHGDPVEQVVPTGDWPYAIRVLTAPPDNVAAARNVGFEWVAGDLVVLLNDDVVASPTLLAEHLAGHAAAGPTALVLGRADFPVWPAPTIFDELLQSTSLMFFYDRLRAGQWYNFRHAWTLNLSGRRELLVRERFDERLAPVNFEDLEWAFRLERRAIRVYYHPAAHVEHHHRYDLERYLLRERQLGMMAVRLAQVNAGCFRAIFKSDLDESLLAYCADFCAREAADAESLRQFLAGELARPAATLPADDSARRSALQTLYFAQRPLKRHAFRRGLLDAAAQRDTPYANPTLALSR